MTDSLISITIPAESRFVSFARVAASSLAAELDFTVEEIEELRVGANELVAFLIERAEDEEVSSVDLEFRVGHDVVSLWGAVPGADGDLESAKELDQLTTQILGAVVDEHEVGSCTGHIVKRRTSA